MKLFKQIRKIISGKQELPSTAKGYSKTTAGDKTLAVTDLIKGKCIELAKTGEFNGKLGRFIDIDELYPYLTRGRNGK